MRSRNKSVEGEFGAKVDGRGRTVEGLERQYAGFGRHAPILLIGDHPEHWRIQVLPPVSLEIPGRCDDRPGSPVNLDDLDWQLLELLQSDGRLTFSELGRRVSLSPPAVTERIRRLEENGIITGYRASVDLTKLGLPIEAMVRAKVQSLDTARFRETILPLPRCSTPITSRAMSAGWCESPAGTPRSWRSS